MLKKGNWFYDCKGKREKNVMVKEDIDDHIEVPYSWIVEPISEKEAFIGTRLGSEKKVASILEKLI